MRRVFFTLFLLSMLLFFGCSPDETSSTEDMEAGQVELTEDDEQADETLALVDIEQNIEWAEEAIFYQVFVRSFYDGSGDGIGDFKGLKEQIPYFVELGVDALWLMPINKASSYHGYDVEDYYDIEPDLGSMADFAAFLEEAHENNIKVILDFVVNHTSINHEWFQTALADQESEYHDYYIWDDHETYQGQESNEQGWHEIDGRIYSGHYNNDMPDLNYRNPAVREEVKAIASFWINKGVDGFRLDGAPEIDEDEKQTIEWWREFNAHVKSENPEAFIVGENWFHTIDGIRPYYSAMESSFNFVLTEDILDFTNGVTMDLVEEVNGMREQYLRFSNARGQDFIIDATMIGNHDLDRVVSRFDGDREKAKLAASVLMTLPGTPFIYYGEELGQEGQRPDDNRREPFSWYKEAKGPGMTVMNDRFFHSSAYTHPNDGISLEEQKGVAGSVYEHYKKLIAIRKDHPMLFTGNYETIDTEFGLYGYTVHDEDSDYQLTMIHNQRNEERTVKASENELEELLTGAAYSSGDDITLPPYHSIILKSAKHTIPVEEVVAEIPDLDYSVTFQVTVPEETPVDDDIYLVGEFNQWDPEDEQYILNQVDDYVYEITIDGKAFSMIQYKITRGDWDSREQNSAGEDLIGERQTENRIYQFSNNEHVEEVVIESWADQ
ncbi:Glycosidase [Evansella caseinilytica]|uniref:Glycosidase n=2 Tax=Evansella TaxID=2837485 RepID=A0A1H3Q6P7_9BACI|nr:alpha-amylase family glycosyl hydrolase [Evansella caseinilytica]SDZ08940.1 Glycosidase [Evansella caseinilytica]